MRHLRSALQVAWRSMFQNRLRVTLTVLGIIAGVTTIVFVAHVSESASSRILAQLNSLLSARSLVVNSLATFRDGRLTRLVREDAAALRRLQDVRSVAVYQGTRATVIAGNKNRRLDVAGITLPYFGMRGYFIAQGEPWNPEQEERGAAVCVLGQAAAESLFGGVSALGKTVRIRTVPFSVVGVTRGREASSVTVGQDDRIFVPIGALQRRLLGSSSSAIEAIFVESAAEEQLPKLVERVDSLMLERRRIARGRDRDYKITTQSELRERQESINATLALLFTVVATLSLIAAGVGVMNIMLVSVAERTREVGLRLSLGARRADILLQFLVESLLMTSVGAVIGSAAGLGLAWSAAVVMGAPFSFNWAALSAALVLSFTLGLVFGLGPALRAARLDPVKALAAAQ